MSLSLFRVELYDKAYTRLGRLGGYRSLSVTLRHNAVGTWTLVARGTDANAAMLAEPGNRVCIYYRDQLVLSGPMTPARVSGSSGGSTLTVSGIDDLAWLSRRLAWPVPGSVIGSQSGAEYDVRTGNAETVIKGYVTANAVTRLPVPGLSVATNGNRGATVTGRARMQTVLEVVAPLADAGGIGLRLRQSGAGIVFDCYTPATVPVRLSEKLSNLRDWEYEASAPAATRMVGGGQGEGTARVFRARTTGVAQDETDWGIIEAFVDARDVSNTTELDARIDAKLLEAAPLAGFAVTPRETAAMRFGTDYNLGDKVRVEVADGVTVDDVIREVTLDDTRDGPSVVPIVGSPGNAQPENAVYRRIQDLGRDVMNLQTRR